MELTLGPPFTTTNFLRRRSLPHIKSQGAVRKSRVHQKSRRADKNSESDGRLLMSARWSLTLSEVRDKCRSLGDVQFAQWAVDVGMLSSQHPKCCGLDMHIGVKGEELEGCAYRCKVCRAYVSIRRNSWCHGSHVKVRDLA